MVMNLPIADIWTHLYMHNPKIQAFAVIQKKEVVWQTDNWNLVKDVDTLLEAILMSKESIKISKVNYEVVSTKDDTLIATSPDGKGHILMAKAKNASWLVSWATADSVPDLSIIDLRYAASKLT
jgi:hypothetical protein